MAVEQPTWEKRNRISCALRSIMAKFTPTINGNAANGAFYDGSDLCRTSAEDKIKNAFPDDTISREYALARLGGFRLIAGSARGASL